jgi:LysR family transcriptional regulator, regulator for genes of the gallate degradation pathway
LRLDHGSYDELLTRLRGGLIDFLVGQLKNPAPADDVRELALRREKYVVAVRRGHPLAGKRNVTRNDLLGAEWVAPRPSAQRRTVFEKIFERGPLPHYSVETHSLLTILVMLSESDRLALMAESELGLDRRLGRNLVALDYEVGGPPIEIGVTIRDHWEQSRLQRKFLNFLRTQPG